MKYLTKIEIKEQYPLTDAVFKKHFPSPDKKIRNTRNYGETFLYAKTTVNKVKRRKTFKMDIEKEKSRLEKKRDTIDELGTSAKSIGTALYIINKKAKKVKGSPTSHNFYDLPSRKWELYDLKHSVIKKCIEKGYVSETSSHYTTRDIREYINKSDFILDYEMLEEDKKYGMFDGIDNYIDLEAYEVAIKDLPKDFNNKPYKVVGKNYILFDHYKIGGFSFHEPKSESLVQPNNALYLGEEWKSDKPCRRKEFGYPTALKILENFIGEQ